MVDLKVNSETAIQEFERFIETMCIDADVEQMTEDDEVIFNEHRNKILRAMERADLVITENGEPIYTPRVSEACEALHFYMPTGRTLMAIDGYGKGKDIAKLYGVMGALTKTHSVRFEKLAMPDLKVCQALTALFLA